MEQKEKLHSCDSLFQRVLKETIDELKVEPVTGAAVEDVVAQASNQPQLVGSFVESLKEKAKMRIEGDSDFRSDRFPSAAKIFKPEWMTS